MTVEIKFTNNSDKKNIKPLQLSNPIALAAGFDKNGLVLNEMLELGFGAVEIGTVTLQPQAGNPQPRLFRLPDDQALINRYGFNSQGALAVQANLQAYHDNNYNSQTEKQRQTDSSWIGSIWNFVFSSQQDSSSKTQNNNTGVVGINIGKNKATTKFEDVLEDYTQLIQILGPYADYLVVNVSSPNTPDLRDTLQNDLANLTRLLQACLDARDALANTDQNKNNNMVPPLFVKLAPDLSDDDLVQIAQTCLACKIDGIVVTNTTNTRPSNLVSRKTLRQQAGGLSGRPIKDVSTNVIRKVYAAVHGQLPIIGVGGVATGADAYKKLRAGACFVQLYSTLVYDGPGAVSRIRHELAATMLMAGYRKVSDLIGLDHEDLYWKKRRAILQLQEQKYKEEHRREQNALAADQQQEESVAAAVTSSSSSSSEQQQQQQTQQA